MNEKIFRQKSLDKIKSPESLDDCIQVSNPEVWLLLISVIILLAGACVWGIFGHIDSTVDASVRAESGTVICYADGSAAVQEGMAVKFGGFEAVIADISQDNGKTVCVLKPEQTVPDGFYEGKIVTESYKPLSFILNRGF